MLLPETDMQISFLKDLVSLRTPTSPYSFVNYLHQQGRLSDFINLQTFFPSRAEFHDYLQWAAGRVSLPVSYGTPATSVDWDGARFVVTTPDQTLTARNVVMGAGLTAALPDGVTPSARVFHNQNLLESLTQVPSRAHKRFLVVGAGQSAAEAAAHLHATYPEAEVHASFRRFGYTPSDDTPYANRIFDPEAVDDFYSAPPVLKQRLLNYHWQTNYAAVDGALINDLFQREYEEKVSGQRRLFIHRITEATALTEGPDGVQVTVSDLAGRHQTALTVDAVIYATGYRPSPMRDLLGPNVNLDEAFCDGLPVVARDYRLNLPGVAGGLYLNGGVEHSHGLSSPLLSNVPVRAADILGALTSNGSLDRLTESSEQRLAVNA
jgi:L-ornithine N5-oxygenase